MPFGYREEQHARQSGWYPDARDPSADRWWNGVSWSDSRRPRGGGPVTSVTGPSPEAITYAAAPRQTAETPSGQAAPPMRTVGTTTARSRPSSGRRSSGATFAVVAAVIGLWTVISTGNATFSVIAAFASLFAIGGAARTRSGGAAIAAVLALIAAIVGIVFAMGPESWREGVQQLLGQLLEG